MAGALAPALILTGDSAMSVAAALALLVVAGVFSLSNPSRGLIFTAIGAVATAVSAIILTPAPLTLTNEEETVTGTVESSVKGSKGIRAIVVTDEIDGREHAPIRIRLGISDQSKPLHDGDLVRVRGVLEPGDRMADIPFMSISSQVNKADRVSATMFVRADNIEITGRDNSLWYRITHLRTAIAEKCYASGLSPRASSLLTGACLGTGDTNIEVKDRFRATGLAHLLCVSGFHVGIVAWLLALILWPAKAWSRLGRMRYVIILAGVWFFVIITGAQPSAIRAATMISAFYMGGLLQRKASPYNSLALAVGIMIAFNPFNLYSIGFQLSISAILGLLVFADKLNFYPVSRNRPYRLVSIVTVPLAAMIGTAPAVLYWFHRLPLMSVPVNVVATIIFPFFLASGCIAVIFDWQWAIYAADSLCDAILWICDKAMSFDTDLMSGIYLSPSTLAILISVIALCGMALNLSKTSHRYAGGLLALCVGALLLIPSQNAEAEIIAAGNTIGNQMIVRRGNECHIITPKTKMPVDMTNYLNGHAVAESTQIHSAGNTLEIDGVSVAYAGSQNTVSKRTDILLIDGKCKDDIDSLIADCHPHTVLIGANTNESRREEIESFCKGHNVVTHRLFDKAFRVGMSELKALKKPGRD